MINRNSAIILIALVSLVFWSVQNYYNLFVFDHTRIASGEIWRLWSSQYLHTNQNHQWLNLIGLSLFLLLYQAYLSVSKLLITLIYLSTSVGLGLFFFSPDIIYYAGFSGILYGLFITTSLSAVLNKDLILGHTVLGILTIKVIWENIDPSINASSAALINANIATDAHLYGYLAAITLGIYPIIARLSNKFF